MASNAENVSIWWRHHGWPGLPTLVHARVCHIRHKSRMSLTSSDGVTSLSKYVSTCEGIWTDRWGHNFRRERETRGPRIGRPPFLVLVSEPGAAWGVSWNRGYLCTPRLPTVLTFYFLERSRAENPSVYLFLAGLSSHSYTALCPLPRADCGAHASAKPPGVSGRFHLVGRVY